MRPPEEVWNAFIPNMEGKRQFLLRIILSEEGTKPRIFPNSLLWYFEG